jgi:hypothetical protein
MDNPNIHTDLIEPGSNAVLDQPIETYYEELSHVIVTNDYIRVISNGDAFNTETRVSFKMLNRLGFTYAPDSSTQKSSDG